MVEENKWNEWTKRLDFSTQEKWTRYKYVLNR